MEQEDGNWLNAKGEARSKPRQAYKLVGKSVPRNDVPGKVFAETDFVTDVKVPGMVHGRVIRPPKAGAAPVSVDKGSVGTIPRVRIVHQKDFLGLVADTEWDAIRAAEEFKVSWSEPRQTRVPGHGRALRPSHGQVRRGPGQEGARRR